MIGRCSCILLSILAAVSGMPRRSTRSTVPSWHLPCGEEIEMELATIENFEEEVKSSLERLRLQHRLTMADYLYRDYEYLYERVRIGVHDHQYIPNWVPGKNDVNKIKRLVDAKPQMIAGHYPKMHTDLQKFAVAFEELVADETNAEIRDALATTQSYLTAMLCEVETNIVTLPALEMPTRVERSIMKSTDREPVDDTRRLVRDWGVLLKYRDYLHAWRHVFND
ncbi:uncharacterized protein LOC117218558 [Megalopta genalis]|uniref:uncharacterized protein LOC117218558 n=1 Tax=Megalopta genalis TaxID=115081 RepID=UPI0014438818|nr:uncharacterized protein LOC117218558 [Megalopta genalis]